MAIKTAHRKACREDLKALLSGRRGDHVTCSATIDGHKINLLLWGDRHKKLFVFTAGTTELGPPATKRRQDRFNNTYKKLIDRPSVLGKIFYVGSHVIDDGNRTQSDLCKLEFIYKANDGWGCFARGMKALNLRDAHSGFSYERTGMYATR